MKRRLLAALLLLLCVTACADPPTTSKIAKFTPNHADPISTAYSIEGQEVQLIDGINATEIVPGAASKTITRVFGQPAYGDLDGDGDADAALILMQTSGGSGTLYYAAAALHTEGAWQGTNAVFIGDRITPRNITIRKDRIIVNYADRLPHEPMTATPKVGVAKYLLLEYGKLKEIGARDGGSTALEGWVIIGHEVRSFQPCPEETDRWLLGESPALPDIMAAYRQAANGSPPYRPILMALIGMEAAPPRDGFGSDYAAAFFATAVIKVAPEEHCPNPLIRVDSPMPGAQISSPLTVTGQARGIWFFEGDFPLLLTDIRGRTLAERYATAQGPWMTREFVPFTGTVAFPGTAAGHWGWLVLKKDNPSDRLELDDALKIPLYLK